MRKIKILGIAPYEGLKNVMDTIASQRNDIVMTTYHADLDYAPTLLSGLDLETYDAILSRGGTALTLQKLTTLPVFDMELSYYDVLNAITLAEGITENFAIVCYPSIAALAEQLGDILNYDLNILITYSWEDTVKHIDTLRKQGCELVIGDMSACRYARECNIPNMLFNSGSETIKKALNQIVEFSKYYLNYQIENRLIKTKMIARDEMYLIYDETGILSYSSVKGPSHFLTTETKRLISDVKKYGHTVSIKKSKGNTYKFTGEKAVLSDTHYYHFFIEVNKKAELELTGSIIKSETTESSSQFFSFLYHHEAYHAIRRKIEDISKTSLPVFLEGEGGTGKDRLAQIIHKSSRLQSYPLFTINCESLTDAEMKELAGNTNSPFYDNDYTFYFKNCNYLSTTLIEQLITFITSTNMSRRNRLILSWRADASRSDTSTTREYLINKLSCIHIVLPNLSHFIDEIPKLVNMYIHQLNTSHGMQLAGIEPEAMSLLQGYRWTNNLDQLKRVINEAFSGTHGAYIKASLIADILRRETVLSCRNGTGAIDFDIHRPLKDITYDIIMRVLQEENYNQSATAARLGISRTTLWRLLKQF
ncbi:sigma-54-dependent transcriptional regulator [Faecalicatena contorta]|uniref:sigma-54-dependent transcriptional regulator n=1 Tax=Faecalicatena contorta TaxID=39482 RepID=UPI001F1B1345|nr:sigma-54-dependent transcriptional regulator [Faecalicatena contorta]MCF2681507.1 PrpR N-terminal domain-containing protein [Faecalicatena contorta]